MQTLSYPLPSSDLDPKRPLPSHIALILDGNRRWARKKNPLNLGGYLTGHLEGARRVDEIVECALELGIQQLTLFSFSTENWGRPPKEVRYLMALLKNFLAKRCQKMVEQGISFKAIGKRQELPASVVDAIETVEKQTERGERLTLVLAINYGGRDEICRACKKILREVQAKKINEEDINESLISKYLDTGSLPFQDPQLLIRTSGELRLSNFLLWQLAYTEVYVTKTLWPDFSKGEFIKALRDFQSRERRLGK